MKWAIWLHFNRSRVSQSIHYSERVALTFSASVSVRNSPSFWHAYQKTLRLCQKEDATENGRRNTNANVSTSGHVLLVACLIHTVFDDALALATFAVRLCLVRGQA